jgi:hypothetical protein
MRSCSTLFLVRPPQILKPPGLGFPPTHKMMMLALSCFLIIIAVWWQLVPAEHGTLPSLSQQEKALVKAGTWPEHGWVEGSFGKTHYYLLGFVLYITLVQKRERDWYLSME